MTSIPLLAAAFIFGTLTGSFFWTLAQRMSSGEYKGRPVALLTKPSHCTSCGKRINPLYLIPVAGFFLSRMKCPSCGARISPLYPAAECISGALCVCTLLSEGFSLGALCVFLLLSLALVIAWVDYRTMIIPDALVAAFALAALYPAYLAGDWISSIMGMGLLGALFFVIILFFPGGFGGGDMKFASAIGLFAGFELSIVVLEAALVSGTVFGVVYAIASRRGFRIRIPFGPFLAAGLFTAVFFGREILLVYYSVF